MPSPCLSPCALAYLPTQGECHCTSQERGRLPSPPTGVHCACPELRESVFLPGEEERRLESHLITRPVPALTTPCVVPLPPSGPRLEPLMCCACMQPGVTCPSAVSVFLWRCGVHTTLPTYGGYIQHETYLLLPAYPFTYSIPYNFLCNMPCLYIFWDRMVLGGGDMLQEMFLPAY